MPVRHGVAQAHGLCPPAGSVARHDDGPKFGWSRHAALFALLTLPSGLPLPPGLERQNRAPCSAVRASVSPVCTSVSTRAASSDPSGCSRRSSSASTVLQRVSGERKAGGCPDCWRQWRRCCQRRRGSRRSCRDQSWGTTSYWRRQPAGRRSRRSSLWRLGKRKDVLGFSAVAFEVLPLGHVTVRRGPGRRWWPEDGERAWAAHREPALRPAR